MNLFQIATRSFRHYWPTNVAIALGVAAATAVMTGALIVGDSMRGSLTDLTLQRLGQIDELLVSDGFFRQQLGAEIANSSVFQTHYDRVTPAIMFPSATVATESSSSQQKTSLRFAGQVTVLGITDDFWAFDDRLPESLSNSLRLDPQQDQVAINRALADNLQITDAQVANRQATITIRVPKQTQLPADSALGRKTDLIQSLVDFTVVAIIPNQGLGRFGLFPTQSEPYNVYLPIQSLQDSLARTVLKHKSDPRQANLLLLSGKSGAPPSADVSRQLRTAVRPRLEDVGLRLKHVALKYSLEDQPSQTVFAYTSLSSDRLVLSSEATDSIRQAFPDAQSVFTYLANDIRKTDQPSGIPFSMVAGIDFAASAQPSKHRLCLESATTGAAIAPLSSQQIVLNQWAAEDLGASVGDQVTVTFFEPETTHGSQVQREFEFTLVDITTVTTPSRPFGLDRTNQVIPAAYDRAPTVANDPDLTPVVPGVTDAESIEDWDLPFSTADKIRPQDDDYWENFRTTPKAFIGLQQARELFDSRFGQTTSFRIPLSAGSQVDIESKLLQQFDSDGAQLGLHLVPIKRRGLAASSGSTPFDVLFLALSMFVIGSALILVSLLFRLSLQQRAGELGICKASGFTEKRLRRVWLMEMLCVSLLGAMVGILLGVGYAGLMIQGLTTWWVGAIARPFLTMHLSPLSLIVGFASGLLACVATILVSLRRSRKQPIIKLLRGELETNPGQGQGVNTSTAWIFRGGPWLLAAAAVGLAIVATRLAGEPQAGAFMGAGFLLLIAGLMFVYGRLSRSESQNSVAKLSLFRLAMISASRNPLRSTLTIGLVAIASFLIAAVSSFHLTPSERGTAGFDWVAISSQPVFENLNTVAGQTSALGADFLLPQETSIFAFRYQPGEDASCNNLYQSTQPRALGVPSRWAVANPPFGWAGSNSTNKNPWSVLAGQTPHAGTIDDPIPVVLDKNTANYSLKIFALGTVRQVRYDSGESFYFRADGFLENTVLQGSLLMAEKDFVAVFPSVAGYQYFLIDDTPATESVDNNQSLSPTVEILEDRLSDLGFDARSAPKLLANFMSVQNTYLSTFQALGSLGLLLGTIGLAAVQVRSVLERKSELGLMRAVGFQLQQLTRLVLLENVWLLLSGLAVGIGSAMLTVLPHWLVGSATVPWLALAGIFSSIAVVGLIASFLASRNIVKVPLLESLRE